MSSVADNHAGHAHDAAGHAHGHGDHHGGYGGVMRWITTTNHKDIGTLYLWFSFIMFMTGGAMPAWRGKLSETEIAAVLTYAKNSWSNKTGQIVQPAEAAAAK